MSDLTTDPTASSWSKQLRDRLAQLLTRGYFLQRALLIVLTALLAGLIVPIILRSLDQERDRRQALGAAQAKMFAEISEALLTYQTLSLDVTWFGTKEVKNPELQRRAFLRYNDRMVDIQTRLGVQSAVAATLASQSVSKRIDDFLEEIFKEQDTPINQLWVKCETSCDWSLQHKKNEAMLVKAKTLVTIIARDLGLVAPSGA